MEAQWAYSSTSSPQAERSALNFFASDQEDGILRERGQARTVVGVVWVTTKGDVVVVVGVVTTVLGEVVGTAEVVVAACVLSPATELELAEVTESGITPVGAPTAELEEEPE